MTRKFWIFLIPFFIGVATPQGCAHLQGPGIKIYYSLPSAGGFYRKQDQELVLYKDTQGFRCLNPSDWEAVLDYVKACKN